MEFGFTIVAEWLAESSRTKWISFFSDPFWFLFCLNFSVFLRTESRTRESYDVIPNRLPELRMPARVGVSLRRNAA